MCWNLRTPITLLLVAAFAAFSAVGCAKHHDKQEGTVLRAYRLIDAQRTNEAIDLLESESARQPLNVELRVVLASAYAHLGGIKVQRLVAVIGNMSKLEHLNDKLPAINPKASVSEQTNGIAGNITTLMVRFSAIFEVYASIPAITQKQSVYIQHAIEILNGVGSKLKPEDVLYRAVLEVVLLKYSLMENFIGEFVAPKKANPKTCALDFGKIHDSLLVTGKLLIDIFNDIGYANPKQAEQMKKQADETREMVSNLTMFFASSAVIDQASIAFLREAAISQGFGKMIKCSGQ